MSDSDLEPESASRPNPVASIALSNPEIENPRLLSPQDLLKISDGCVKFLKSQHPIALSKLKSWATMRKFALKYSQYLSVSLLCFCYAPRSQILQQLKIWNHVYQGI